MVDRIVGYVCAVLALVSLTIPSGPRVVVVKERWAPLTQWTCAPQETRERAWACAHRDESSGIVERAKHPGRARG